MSENVIHLLRAAYLDEVETVVNYQSNAIILDGVQAEEIKASLLADVQEELGHAEQIGRRLKELGARPPASAEFSPVQESLQPPEDSTDVESVVDGVIEAEEEAIDRYTQLINAAREDGDPVTEDLAVQLLTDEETHLTEFKSYKKAL